MEIKFKFLCKKFFSLRFTPLYLCRTKKLTPSNMNVSENSKAGTLKKSALVRPVSTWRKYPGDKMAAVEAAFHYAIKQNRRIVCVPGNSYMRAIYHLVPTTHELRQLTARKDNILSGFAVDPNGDVFNVTITD